MQTDKIHNKNTRSMQSITVFIRNVFIHNLITTISLLRLGVNFFFQDNILNHKNDI